jgi:hypothetical protein
MAQNKAKLNGEKGDVVGVASDAVASITSPYSTYRGISQYRWATQWKDKTGVMQHTEITGMFQANAHSVYWCDPTGF